MVSNDAKSLFTNVPLEIVYQKLSDELLDLVIPKEENLKAVTLCMESTVFSFQNQLYIQSYGTPMGSPLSGLFADLALRNIEEEVIQEFKEDILVSTTKSS